MPMHGQAYVVTRLHAPCPLPVLLPTQHRREGPVQMQSQDCLSSNSESVRVHRQGAGMFWSWNTDPCVSADKHVCKG